MLKKYWRKSIQS